MEHNFKVGDWICWETLKQVRRIKSLHPFSWEDDLDNGSNLRNHPEEYRLARPEEIPGYIKPDRVRFYVDTLEDEDIQSLLINKAESNGIIRSEYPTDILRAKFFIYDSNTPNSKAYWFNHHHINVDTEYTIAQAIEYFKQPKFKVGDWVTVIKNTYGHGYVDKEIGRTFQIKKFNLKNEFGVSCWYIKDNLSLAENNFRLATKKEIEKATRLAIKVGDYTAKYNLSAGTVEFGCKKYYKEYIKKLMDTMGEGNIAAIKVEGEMVSFHQIEQIYKGFLE